MNSETEQTTNVNQVGKYPARQTGVLVVDPLNDFLSEGGKVYEELKEVVIGNQVIPHLKQLLEGARQKGIKVFYAVMRTDPQDYRDWKFLTPGNQRALKEQIFQAGSWGAEFHPELKPQAGDIVTAPHKTSSAFVSTDLDLELRQHGVEHLVIGGLVANTCVESTGRYAAELGYEVTFLKDTVASQTWEMTNNSIANNYPAYGRVSTVEEFLGNIV